MSRRQCPSILTLDWLGLDNCQHYWQWQEWEGGRGQDKQIISRHILKMLLMRLVDGVSWVRQQMTKQIFSSDDTTHIWAHDTWHMTHIWAHCTADVNSYTLYSWLRMLLSPTHTASNKRARTFYPKLWQFFFGSRCRLRWSDPSHVCSSNRKQPAECFKCCLVSFLQLTNPKNYN